MDDCWVVLMVMTMADRLGVLMAGNWIVLKAHLKAGRKVFQMVVKRAGRLVEMLAGYWVVLMVVKRTGCLV